jgi:ribosomal protein S18 acetylase RimI-like enzyme
MTPAPGEDGAAPSPVAVRDAVAADAAAWRRLWDGYVTFYDARVDEATTAHTFARIVDPLSPVFCRLADDGGVVTGFAVCVLHEATRVRTPVCYLEDLYVDPAARRRGVGRALVDDLVALCRLRGWSRLYWHTRGSNAGARRLYDRFGAADGFVRYVVDTR